MKYTGAAGAALAASGALPAFASPGEPVEKMTVLTSNAAFDPVRPEMGRLITVAAKQIGWDLELAAEEYGLGINKVMGEQDFDMFIVQWTGRSDRLDPNQFIGDLFRKDGALNKWGYDNARLNELAAAQEVAMDPEKRRALVMEAQKVIFDDAAHSPIVYPDMTNAYREDRLEGLVPMVGEGIGSFWSDLSVSVKTGDGYIRVGATTALANLNPVAALDSKEFQELRLIYDRLAQVGPDGEVVMWAAEAITIVDDNTIDIALRPGMKWHDGKPVTIDDVIFSFEYQRQWKAPSFAAILERFEGVTKTGDNTLQIKLKQPYAPLMINLFCSMFIIPQHIWQDIPQSVGVDDVLKFANEKPVGSGAFTFDYWDRGKEFKVSANKEHFSAPKCEGIIRIVYGSHDALAAAIEVGECDSTRYVLKPSLVQDLDKVEGVVGKGYPSHGVYSLCYNVRRGPLTDPKFRQALDMIVPRDLIREAVMNGYAVNAGSMIAPANAFWCNTEIEPRKTDVEAARALLEEAGYSWDGAGKLLYPA